MDKIIGQTRGLIKDIWYDNSLEKKKKEQELSHQEKLNELELARQKTSLVEQQIGVMRNAGFSDEEIQENIKKLTDPVEKIYTLMQHREVKLLEDDENT